MVVSFSYFLLHTLMTPAGKSFFDRRLMRNPNYVSGVIMIFIIGMVLFATRALLATMLQNLFGYPASLAGLVMAPSGVGTMIAMLIVGRLTGKVDIRILLTVGFALTALSCWQMIHYDLTMTQSAIVWPGLLQGFGLGIVFVPLTAAAFATLSPELRADGTATFSLMRNIGSAIGIAATQALLVRNTQIVHAGLVENMTRAHGDLFSSPLGATLGLEKLPGVAALNEEITRQAAMIAYLDDFRLLLVLTVMVIPALILLKPPKKNAPSAVADAEAIALE